NRNDYEEMLMYIRLSFNKSQQETEEVLSELLDHVLQAQEEGKTVQDVFGNDPKQYAKEIAGELPKMITKERTKLMFMGILYFFAASIFVSGIYNYLMYYAFQQGELMKTYQIGTVVIEAMISIPIALGFLYGIIYYIRWSCFKHISKVLEFLMIWIYGVLSLGVFLLLFYVTPAVGPEMSMPHYMLLFMGIVLFVVAQVVKGRK